MLVPQPFGSIVFLLPDKDSGGWARHLERCAQWLDEWLTWFLAHNGILSGRNLHMLYDRSVSALGPGALSQRHQISRIAQVAARHGATFASELYVSDCLRQPDDCEELLQAGVLKSVIFNPDGCSAAEDGESVCAVVEAAAELGIAVILVGLPSFWKDVGVLDSPILNAGNFRIIPAQGQWRPGNRTSAARPAGKSCRNGERPAAALSTAWLCSPCEGRFAVYVTATGTLYPCLGLVGCAQWCMGTIDSPPEESRFAADAELAVLAGLASRGPDLSAAASVTVNDDLVHLPRVCAVHRGLVLADAHAD